MVDLGPDRTGTRRWSPFPVAGFAAPKRLRQEG
jgi:hypothetical protein